MTPRELLGQPYGMLRSACNGLASHAGDQSSNTLSCFMLQRAVSQLDLRHHLL